VTDRMTGALPDEPVTEREAIGVLAAVAGIAALAGPRRTRPLAGFLYGVALSRVHGAARAHLERTLLRLFDERASVHARLDEVERLLGGRLADVEIIVAHAGPSGLALLDERVSAAHQRVRDRVPGLEHLRGLRGGAA
jgi:hypothetical protein